MQIDAIAERLGGPWATEVELNNEIRQLGKIPRWDNAGLGATRQTLINRGVIRRGPDGRLVKGEPFRVPTHDEIDEQRLAKEQADEAAARERTLTAATNQLLSDPAFRGAVTAVLQQHGLIS
jgi:hypothetical protein